jgi:uncharacterized repeat protein (TIGR01451 family)
MTKTIKRVLNDSVFATLAAVALSSPGQAATGGITLNNSVLVQQKSAAADGTTRVVLVPAKRAVPGDHVVFRITYKNDVGQPVTGMVVSNPVPADLTYRGPAEGSPAPEVSTDGVHFAALSALTVAGHPARAEQVRAVRWLVNGTVRPGATGRYSFEATIR